MLSTEAVMVSKKAWLQPSWRFVGNTVGILGYTLQKGRAGAILFNTVHPES